MIEVHAAVRWHLIAEASQAEQILQQGQADMIALARGILYDPRWPRHAAAELGAQVQAPQQYWRWQPRDHKTLFGDIRIGQRQPASAPPAFTGSVG